MKKVRVLKELPFAKVGDIYNLSENGGIISPFQYLPRHVERMIESSWLELIEEKKFEDLLGKIVIVYDRHLFAVPVEGVIHSISEYDGAYQVIFFPDNPGGDNVTRHDGKFFHPEQCRII